MTPCPCTVSTAALTILGAPVFDDTTSGSSWCLKRCTACGTVYEWRHEYTYLVNGASEDDTYVTRLEDAGRRAGLRSLFARAKQRTRSTQEPPRSTRLPDEFGPEPAVMEQDGVEYPTYALMEQLRERAPMPAPELAELLAAHARFVAGGGAGGGWRTALTSADRSTALMFAFYGCPAGASADDQAQLQLARLAPGGTRLELPSADLLAASVAGEDLAQANLAGAMLVLVDARGANLRRATLARADCTGARMIGVDLRDADLRGTDFERADLSGADLRGARLDGASFLDTRLVDVRR